jgi:hypothetical protein
VRCACCWDGVGSQFQRAVTTDAMTPSSCPGMGLRCRLRMQWMAGGETFLVAIHTLSQYWSVSFPCQGSREHVIWCVCECYDAALLYVTLLGWDCSAGLQYRSLVFCCFGCGGIWSRAFCVFAVLFTSVDCLNWSVWYMYVWCAGLSVPTKKVKTMGKVLQRFWFCTGLVSEKKYC